MPINRDWHDRHRMPKRATLVERVRWHVAHTRACGCRALPKSIVAELKRQGRRLPTGKR
jgi:hypothetical protein